MEKETELKNWNDPDIYPVWKDDTKPHTLNNLDGIHVPVTDGTEILIYPKYRNYRVLDSDKINKWKAMPQGHPLYARIDQHAATDELLALGSEAAKHVRKYGKDIALPIQLIAIAYYKNCIDTLSKILGGDLLSDIISLWWSCVPFSSYDTWFVDGNYGLFGGYHMFNRGRVIPVSIYKKK